MAIASIEKILKNQLLKRVLVSYLATVQILYSDNITFPFILVLKFNKIPNHHSQSQTPTDKIRVPNKFHILNSYNLNKLLVFLLFGICPLESCPKEMRLAGALIWNLDFGNWCFYKGTE